MTETIGFAGNATVVPGNTRVRTRLLSPGFEPQYMLDDHPVHFGRTAVGIVPEARLMVLNGWDRGRHFDLDKGIYTIGRAATQDIALAGDDYISREGHAIVGFIEEVGRFTLFDGDKANPVWLNDEVVPELAFLEDGDVIRLGETELLFVQF